MLHALVVSVLMFFGQVHFCQPEFVLPSGETCITCPTLTDIDHDRTARTLSAGHGDCHDCCTLRACDDSGKGKAQASPSSLSLEVAAAPELLEFKVEAAQITFVCVPFAEGCPPTGPPSKASSRGPPDSMRR